jgi:hypothetical protein
MEYYFAWLLWLRGPPSPLARISTNKGRKNHVPCMQTAETRTNVWIPSERRVPLLEPALRGRPTPFPFPSSPPRGRPSRIHSLPRCRLRAARTRPLRRTRRTCCYSAALRARRRLLTRSRRCATIASWERRRTGRALARPHHGVSEAEGRPNYSGMRTGRIPATNREPSPNRIVMRSEERTGVAIASCVYVSFV